MIGSTRWSFPEVDSTQNVAFALASMEAHAGTVVRADFQTAGRGRLGRSWDVPASTSLMFSILLRPECRVDELGSLSLVVADTLATVFEGYVSGDVAIKWPNDVLVNGRKVSGILVQTRMVPNLVGVIGIGVNVLQSFEQLPDGATSLSIESESPMSPEDVYERIIDALTISFDGWQPRLHANTISRIEQKLWMHGHNVELLDGDRRITGVIAGVASSGELRLLIDGSERLITSGEITRGPRAISR